MMRKARRYDAAGLAGALRVLRLCGLPALLLLAGCSGKGGEQTAGITTIGNTVAGNVEDGKSALVTNAEVRLIDANYNPVLDTNETGYLTTQTDSTGKFRFDKVLAGTYNVEAIHDGLAAYTQGIKLAGAGGSGEVPPSILTKPGAVTIVLGNGKVKAGGHFYIPGTTRFARIDAPTLSAGILTMRYVPAGSYSALNYLAPGDTVGTNVLTTSFQVNSDDTLLLDPTAAWLQVRKITVNTSLTGADIASDVADFPLLVRLTAGNFDFAKADKNGANLRFLKPDGTSLPYEIERWDSTAATADVWVKMDTVIAADASQYFFLYTGRADSSSLSNGPSVFSTPAGFAGVWHFDSAADFQDASSGQNTALNHGAVETDGVSGKAIRLRGTAWVDVPAQVFTGISKKLSISFWQNGSDTLTPAKGDVFGGQDSAGHMILRLHDALGDTSVYWDAGGIDSTKRDRIEKHADSLSQARGRWNFWTVSKDADKGEMKIYLNGKIWQSGSGKTLPIGRINSFTLAFSGTENYALDEFRVTANPPSDDWVKLSFETQKPNTAAVVVGK